MGKQDAHSPAVKVVNHLANARNAARHRANHVVLIPVVDAHVRIGRPDEHGIDSAVALAGRTVNRHSRCEFDVRPASDEYRRANCRVRPERTTWNHPPMRLS
jgi:hypothetical protein